MTTKGGERSVNEEMSEITVGYERSDDKMDELGCAARQSESESGMEDAGKGDATAPHLYVPLGPS